MQASYKCCNAAVRTLAASLSKSCELISGNKTGITTMSSIVINKKKLSVPTILLDLWEERAGSKDT